MKPNKKLIFKILVYSFAIFGLGLTLAWSAVKLKITNDPGGIDQNDRYFAELNDSLNQAIADSVYSVGLEIRTGELLQETGKLFAKYPVDSRRILEYLASGQDLEVAEKMLAALRLNVQEAQTATDRPSSTALGLQSAFYWMNLPEWPVLKEAVRKDQQVIDSVASVTGVPSRLISAVLIAEQIRLFDSRREAFKKWIEPLKMLTSETSFSWGVTGIKDFTAMAIERNLRDTNSKFYPGSEYLHLLDFKTSNHEDERFSRITDAKNHYYAYLYAALFIKQVSVQWSAAGFPIDKRPEILATLFNIGYTHSEPKPDPQVGGATLDVGGKKYTFGRIAWEYYYSGEMNDAFPL